MWKALATVMAGVVPGIFIGLAIASLFISAPIRSQLEEARKSENRMTTQIATLKGELNGTKQTITETAAAINERGVLDTANLNQIRDICRSENVRAVAAGQAISRISESSRRTASAMSDIADQCPANRLIPAGELRAVLGQTPP